MVKITMLQCIVISSIIGMVSLCETVIQLAVKADGEKGVCVSKQRYEIMNSAEMTLVFSTSDFRFSKDIECEVGGIPIVPGTMESRVKTDKLRVLKQIVSPVFDGEWTCYFVLNTVHDLTLRVETLCNFEVNVLPKCRSTMYCPDNSACDSGGCCKCNLGKFTYRQSASRALDDWECLNGCRQNDDCSYHSFCKEGICTCDEDYARAYPDEYQPYKKCVPKCGSAGTARCHDNASCKDDYYCSCNEGFIFDFTNDTHKECTPWCGADSDCPFESYCVNDACVCKEGKVFGYSDQSKNRECVTKCSGDSMCPRISSCENGGCMCKPGNMFVYINATHKECRPKCNYNFECQKNSYCKDGICVCASGYRFHFINDTFKDCIPISGPVPLSDKDKDNDDEETSWWVYLLIVWLIVEIVEITCCLIWFCVNKCRKKQPEFDPCQVPEREAKTPKRKAKVSEGEAEVPKRKSKVSEGEADVPNGKAKVSEGEADVPTGKAKALKGKAKAPKDRNSTNTRM